jgi:hypothetical protein
MKLSNLDGELKEKKKDIEAGDDTKQKSAECRIRVFFQLSFLVNSIPWLRSDIKITTPSWSVQFPLAFYSLGFQFLQLVFVI